MKTKVKEIFVAFDGEEFENKEDCIKYENANSAGLFSKCVFVDDDENPLTLEQFYNDPSDVFGLYVPDDECAQLIQRIYDERDKYSPWDDRLGTVRPTPGYFWYSDDTGEFENIEKRINYWQKKYNLLHRA